MRASRCRTAVTTELACAPSSPDPRDAKSRACPCCQGALHAIGEDVSERLDVVPAQFQDRDASPEICLSVLRGCRGPGAGSPRLVEGGMTMSAAREWAKFGVRKNSICFAVVETPMTETIKGDKFRDGVLARIPMGRWADRTRR